MKLYYVKNLGLRFKVIASNKLDAINILSNKHNSLDIKEFKIVGFKYIVDIQLDYVNSNLTIEEFALKYKLGIKFTNKILNIPIA